MHLSSFWTKKQFNVDISPGTAQENLREANKQNQHCSEHTRPWGIQAFTVQNCWLWLFIDNPNITVAVLRSSHRINEWVKQKTEDYRPISSHTPNCFSTIPDRKTWYINLSPPCLIFGLPHLSYLAGGCIQTLWMSTAALIYVEWPIWVAVGKNNRRSTMSRRKTYSERT